MENKLLKSIKAFRVGHRSIPDAPRPLYAESDIKIKNDYQRLVTIYRAEIVIGANYVLSDKDKLSDPKLSEQVPKHIVDFIADYIYGDIAKEIFLLGPVLADLRHLCPEEAEVVAERIKNIKKLCGK